VGVNRDKVDLWKADVARSVDFYNKPTVIGSHLTYFCVDILILVT
jgi:hypothetical protein